MARFLENRVLGEFIVIGKVLIVEDEPIVALDLKQEVEQLGCEVVGVAESAEEALVAVELCRPDLALLDVRIAGSMDGIQTARMLRGGYRIPAVFLTSYSDETTIARAAREMPYGYLTKPFQSCELKATLRVALHKAKMDAGEAAAHREIAATVGGMREGVLMVSREGKVQFMNAAAEGLTGWTLSAAAGRGWKEVLRLSDRRVRALPELCEREDGMSLEEFGWTLTQEGGRTVQVDLSFAPIGNGEQKSGGYVVTVRDAAARMRCQAIDETLEERHSFEHAPMAMVQLDALGHIVRVNKALLQESGVAAESLLGRSLTGLSMDPDPRIAKDLMNTLLKGGTFMATTGPHVVN